MLAWVGVAATVCGSLDATSGSSARTASGLRVAAVVPAYPLTVQVQVGISKRPSCRSGAQDSDCRLSPEVFTRGSCGASGVPEDYEQGLQRPTISSACPVATKCLATVADDTISSSAVSDSFDSSMSSIEPQISHLVW